MLCYVVVVFKLSFQSLDEGSQGSQPSPPESSPERNSSAPPRKSGKQIKHEAPRANSLEAICSIALVGEVVERPRKRRDRSNFVAGADRIIYADKGMVTRDMLSINPSQVRQQKTVLRCFDTQCR